MKWRTGDLTGRNVSDAPSAFPEGGWAVGGLRDAGWHLPLAARVFISRREEMPDQVGHDGVGVLTEKRKKYKIKFSVC